MREKWMRQREPKRDFTHRLNVCVRERAVGLVGLRKEQGHKIALCFTEAET